MATTIPGSAGHSFLSDESLEFWRDTLSYIDRRVKEHGPVFTGRILNKPTIFITSNSTVQELLCDNHENFSSGYHEYMFELFDKNIMFLEGDEWRCCCDVLRQSFSDDTIIQRTTDIAKQLIEKHVKATPTNEPVKVYQHLKLLTTQLSIGLFLSPTLSEAESREVSELMTTHWHGIISLPVNMRLPLLPWRSGYSKALTAKGRLLEIISQQLATNEASPIANAVHRVPNSHDSTPSHTDHTPSSDDPTPSNDDPTPSNDDSTPSNDDSTPSNDDHTPSNDDSTPSHTNSTLNSSLSHESVLSHDLAIRNILLFISALFPKAMASLMTSILVQLSKPENSMYVPMCISALQDGDEQLVESIILECQRLWPPFFGGRRICTKSCVIGGYTIPKGHPVVYISHTANSDTDVFSDPDVFRPERWSEDGMSKDLLLSFGGGPRGCAGRHLSTIILKEWFKSFLSSLSWKPVSGTELPYKVLPVTRPSDEVVMMFNEK